MPNSSPPLNDLHRQPRRFLRHYIPSHRGTATMLLPFNRMCFMATDLPSRDPSKSKVLAGQGRRPFECSCCALFPLGLLLEFLAAVYARDSGGFQLGFADFRVYIVGCGGVLYMQGEVSVRGSCY